MTYVLESETEFERLEHQSTFPKYDYRKELAEFKTKPNATILDAGCGSGVVSRYLGQQYPNGKIIGCDAAKDRLEFAKNAAKKIPNVSFQPEDLSKMTFASESFDAIICRYVLQHVESKGREKTLKEMARILRPDGKVCLIDFDGPFYNLYPQTPLVAQVLSKLEESGPVDLRIGRKLPHMLSSAGFENVSWRIDTIECRDSILQDEMELIPPKLESIVSFLTEFLGSRKKALQFNAEYMECLKVKGVVLFYNKFIATGVKPKSKKLKIVK